MTEARKHQDDDDDAFMQKYALSEEDLRLRYPTIRWSGGYRWFRSPNVVRLELYRDREAMVRIEAALRLRPWALIRPPRTKGGRPPALVGAT